MAGARKASLFSYRNKEWGTKAVQFKFGTEIEY